MQVSNVYHDEDKFGPYLPMSKMDFTPAETKPTGQRVSSWRSADMSMAVDYICSIARTAFQRGYVILTRLCASVDASETAIG